MAQNSIETVTTARGERYRVVPDQTVVHIRNGKIDQVQIFATAESARLHVERQNARLGEGSKLVLEVH